MKKIIPILLLILEPSAGVPRVFAQATATPTMLCCTLASPWIPPTPSAAYGVAVDTTRARVYVTDEGLNSGEGLVLAFNYDGTTAASFGTGGAVSVAGALWVAVGKGPYDGVYVTQRDYGAGITKLDSNGNIVWSRNPPPAGGWRGVGLDDWGNVYATNETGQIMVWDNNGNQKSPVFSGTLNAPTGIWSSGLNLVVADTLNFRIVQYVESGVNTYSYTQTQAVTLGMDPYGITTDLVGNFYIAFKGYGYGVFDGNFVQKTQICAWGNSIGISLDETGAIYVATDNGNFVQKMQACFPQTLPTYHGLNPPLSGESFVYPSPVKGNQANLSYKLAESGLVELKIWNERAELVDDVTDSKSAGVQVTPFNVSGFASGVYFYSLILTYASGKVETIKPHKFVVIH